MASFLHPLRFCNFELSLMSVKKFHIKLLSTSDIKTYIQRGIAKIFFHIIFLRRLRDELNTNTGKYCLNEAMLLKTRIFVRNQVPNIFWWTKHIDYLENHPRTTLGNSQAAWSALAVYCSGLHFWTNSLNLPYPLSAQFKNYNKYILVLKFNSHLWYKLMTKAIYVR